MAMARKVMQMSSLCAALLVSPALASAEEAPAVDADFLEFLGSWDSDDEAWAEFLASTEIRETSKSKAEEPAQSKQVDP